MCMKKAVKQILLILFSDANTMVCHMQPYPVALLLYGNLNFSSIGGIFDSILNESSVTSLKITGSIVI